MANQPERVKLAKRRRRNDRIGERSLLASSVPALVDVQPITFLSSGCCDPSARGPREECGGGTVTVNRFHKLNRGRMKVTSLTIREKPEPLLRRASHIPAREVSSGNHGRAARMKWIAVCAGRRAICTCSTSVRRASRLSALSRTSSRRRSSNCFNFFPPNMTGPFSVPPGWRERMPNFATLLSTARRWRW